MRRRVRGRSHLRTYTPSTHQRAFTLRSSLFPAPNRTRRSYRLYSCADMTRPLLPSTSSYIFKVFICFLLHHLALAACLRRQRGKPTPSHPCLRRVVERCPITGHPCARPTILCRFPLPDIAVDNLRPLPRSIHRALLASIPQGRIERSTRRGRARPRARKCVYERARHGPRALPATLAALPLPRPIRARQVGCTRCRCCNRA